MEYVLARSSKKQAMFNEFARIGKGVSHPARLELLDLLCQAPRTVDILAQMLGQSIAITSHHLRVLAGTRLVSSERDGKYITYRLADKDVCEFWQVFQKLAYNHLADLRQAANEFLKGSEKYDPVDRDTLLERMQQREVTLIDVRPEEEYLAEHLPGALSVPLEKLEEILPMLPKNREIVAYCRGPYCVLSLKAVEYLDRHEFKATRLLDGVPQWLEAGLSTESGQTNNIGE